MQVYINWLNTSLFIIPGTLPTLNLPIETTTNQVSYFFLI